MNNLIIFGGTFDPIHLGHLNTAIAVQEHFHFDRFIFLPCKLPLLKQEASATTAQRVAMLRLALSSTFEVDLFEIERKGSSYTVDSLQYFRQKEGKETALTFLMGMDSFLQLPQWHAWEQLLALSNLLILHRSGQDKMDIPPLLKAFLQQHETKEGEALKRTRNGLIYRFNAGNFPISSRELRKQLRAGENVKASLPEQVWDFIIKYELYRE